MQPTSDLLWQHLKTLPAFRALLRAVEARFYHQFDIPGPILDLGCGDGDFANHTFNEFGRKIDVGFDPWLQPLKKSVQHNIYKDGALQAMGDEMPFPSNHFEAVLSNSVLEHIADITPVLVEAGRVLKPGGVFLMTMPNHRFTEMLWGAQFFEKRGMGGLAERYRGFFNFVSRHQHTEPVEWWADRLAQAGMVVERWEYYFSPAALHTLEFGHIQGLPSLVTHAFTGKWVVAPVRESLGITDRWVRPYYLEQASEEGCYQFILARKVSDQPIETPILPDARPFEVLPDGSLKQDEISTQMPMVLPAGEHATSSILANNPDSLDLDINVDVDVQEVDTNRLKLPGIPAIAGILGGFVLSLIAIFLTDGRGTDRPWLAIVFWLLSIGSTGVGLAWSHASFETVIAKITQKLSFNNLLIPTALFVVAWLIRGWSLTSHPWIISGTEAAIGLEKLLALSGFQQNPFGTDALTNPLLPYFLTSFTEFFFGPSVFALRVLSPLVGGATVVLVYLTGRRFWGEVAGLGAAVLLLGNHTHIHYSRLGLTNIWDPLLILASTALLVIAWQKRGRLTWLAAGLVSGLSFYFYTAGHLLPAVIPLLFMTLLFTDEFRKVLAPVDEANSSHSLRKTLRSAGAAAILSVIVILPLLAHYNRTPGRFTDRLVSQGVAQTNWIEYQGAVTGLSPAAVWRGQILDSLSILSLSSVPDLSAYYGSQLGLMSLVPTLLFLIGLILIIMQGLRAENQMVLWALVILILGAGVILLNPPQSHRYLVLLPFTTLLAGVALQRLADAYQRKLAVDHQKWLMIAVVVIAALSVTPDLRYYFGTWPQDSRFTDRNTEVAFEIATYLNDLPENSWVYLQTDPMLNSSFPTIGYLAPHFRRGENLTDLLFLDVVAPELSPQGKTAFIVLPERAQELERLRASFPSGQTAEVSGFFADPLFTVFEVEK
ncbi:MAG: SAM-dependent methyltransferase/4-amino-4-deoxy-L-arabinose transferase-like glycosyltransferase [Cellvibrionaceae bacterium]|jgi:SAM-dependent methyltransferase/4-amino-4-deoxy-L-arabinose transferase-like glycosyltransferase